MNTSHDLGARSFKFNPFLDTTINYETQVQDKLNLRHDREFIKEELRLLTKTLTDMEPEVKASLDERITLRSTISYHSEAPMIYPLEYKVPKKIRLMSKYIDDFLT